MEIGIKGGKKCFVEEKNRKEKKGKTKKKILRVK